ncbi:unnamed protein product [Cylindrotheca closterium]|uniref:Uncharacterized protein n=1 Tax=Cylindrotheca closterium TaxID=2856 RepID=A0AAD2G6E2_9STRA|nr:unnamed protein product [Cylindrotheca closterium]
MRSVAILAFLSTLIGAVGAVDRPRFEPSARVKLHLVKTTGEVMVGHEDKRKILLKWGRYHNAEQYELCHNCDNIDEVTGEVDGDIDEEKIISIGTGRQFECGGDPCLVYPDAPLGYNKFHLRVLIGDKWSKWSKHKNYHVDEPGALEHREL